MEHEMLAYCDRKTGAIHFGEAKPRGATLIAKHPDDNVLRRAVEAAGAQTLVTWRGQKKLSESLAVPWYSTAKYPDEEAERIASFAERVQACIASHV